VKRPGKDEKYHAAQLNAARFKKPAIRPAAALGVGCSFLRFLDTAYY
jgi:hypothetical protein